MRLDPIVMNVGILAIGERAGFALNAEFTQDSGRSFDNAFTMCHEKTIGGQELPGSFCVKTRENLLARFRYRLWSAFQDNIHSHSAPVGALAPTG